ncbi:MAG: hypothetical protein J3K34DRAFT_523406 [Monoraphidium minutum]|nr:MAG: hypothetical protein J3K34DRAFT_523406 [Monoraphidium minutum]
MQHGSTRQRRLQQQRAAARRSGAARQPGAGAWWDRISKRSAKGPAPPAVDPAPTTSQGWNELRMGVKGYREFETVKRDERQRVWDEMRDAARRRYQRGEMPPWFRPAWLDMEEAPTNTFWRAGGLGVYQQDTEWLGGGGDGGGGKGGGGGGGWRWWREEDPYWPLRDWGDHPMRWWTLGFAALLAAGGLAASGAPGGAGAEAARWGLGAGAALALCGAAMSDMGQGGPGALAVKAAWAICLALAAREYWWGWRHKRGRRARVPRVEGCGATALAMCGLYMWTGMGGLSSYALPANPGQAFKMSDVATKSKIWEAWGYSDVTLR